MSDDDEPCECGSEGCAIAREIFDRAEAELPAKVELFFLDRGDRLCDDQVKEIFLGQYDAVQERIDDWFRDNDHYAIDYEIERVLQGDEIEVLKAHPSRVMPSHWNMYDELAELVRERDESDPMGELIKATPDVMLKLDTCVAIDDTDSPEEIIQILHRELGVSPVLNRERILNWLEEHGNEVWGGVEIVWRADVQEAVDQFRPWGGEDRKDEVAVFTDPWIMVGGSLLELRGEVTVPITPMNDLPCLEYDLCCDRDFACSPKLMPAFEHYREGLVEFFDYREKILAGK